MSLQVSTLLKTMIRFVVSSDGGVSIHLDDIGTVFRSHCGGRWNAFRLNEKRTENILCYDGAIDPTYSFQPYLDWPMGVPHHKWTIVDALCLHDLYCFSCKALDVPVVRYHEGVASPAQAGSPSAA